jgi:hypothetical protein
MNWYIGQEIVAVKSHPHGHFVKGQDYVIKGLRDSQCKCNEVEIDIGVRDNYNAFCCKHCNTTIRGKFTVCFFSETNFAPKQSTYSEAEIENVNVDELIEIIKEPEYA